MKQKAKSSVDVSNGGEEGLSRRGEKGREITGDGVGNTIRDEKARFHRGHGVHKGPSLIPQLLLKQPPCIWTCGRYCSSIQR